MSEIKSIIEKENRRKATDKLISYLKENFPFEFQEFIDGEKVNVGDMVEMIIELLNRVKLNDNIYIDEEGGLVIKGSRSTSIDRDSISIGPQDTSSSQDNHSTVWTTDDYSITWDSESIEDSHESVDLNEVIGDLGVLEM